MTESIFLQFDSFFVLTSSVLVITYLCCGIDSLFMDAYAWARGLHAGNPEKLTRAKLCEKKQKRIAIAVAAWNEASVIGRMVRGNTQRIDYSRYDFFIGLYPNDPASIEILEEAQKQNPKVNIVLNTKPGPTSKGQMMNEVITEILSRRDGDRPRYDAVLFHDSEDLIHPFALRAINSELDRHDFIQVPVLSLPVGTLELVAGTYMDEFSEIHSKDVRLRNLLTGSFPAAGVGMAMSRSLVERFLLRQGGELFNEKSLTEDYELGLKARHFGGRCRFLYAELIGNTGIRDVIATREYFPKKLRRSIRQKTRWSTGISFQGFANLGWFGPNWCRYFLYRDRIGPWANLATMFGTFFWGVSLFAWTMADVIPQTNSEIVKYGGAVTGVLMLNRLFQKVYASKATYGWRAALGAPFRTILANFINACASFQAATQYFWSRWRGLTLKWAKTDHELPDDFGLELVSTTKLRRSAERVLTSLLAFALLNFIVGFSSPALALGEKSWQPAPVPQHYLDPSKTIRNWLEPEPPRAARDPSRECVRIYYDDTMDPSYAQADYYTIFLSNLLAHFPQFQQIIEPIENYAKGDLESCRASFYIGSYFENQIPEAFLEDFSTTKKSVVWMGYSIWKLGEVGLERSFGVKYSGLTTLENEIRDERSRPTFFRDVVYKGETFSKYGEFDFKDPTQFHAPFEMTALEILKPTAAVMAEALHNGNGTRLPYALRQENRFYVGDIPFSFMHEGDRYLIFCDILFDVLDVSPEHLGKRPAVLRFEDIHARVPHFQVFSVTEAVKRLGIPLHIALIPIFYDPLYEMDRAPQDEIVPIHQDHSFKQVVQRLRDQETTYIWHGVTHQYGKIRNAFTGASGDDFEFWNINRNSPINEDGVAWVLRRLDRGWKAIEGAGLHSQIWESPHYQASVLDYVIFGNVFSWNIGRVVYSPVGRYDAPPHDPLLWYANSGSSGSQARLKSLRYLTIEANGPPAGQFFPFEIYGDYFGQRVLPENLGNPQPFLNEQVVAQRSIDDILRDAKRNLKLRDVWGSFFLHPQLVNTRDQDGLGDYPGDAREITRLVSTLQDMGYQFINLNQFIETRKTTMRPPIIWISRKSGVR